MEKDKSGYPQEQLMTIKEVAAYLKINVYTVYRMAERGAIPGVKLGRAWRFKKDEIYKWLADKMTTEKKTRLEKWQKKYGKLMDEKP